MRRLKSVLLVDDDDTTNFLNRFFVKQLDSNLAVNTACNGKEAIEFLTSSPKEENMPCLLILDTNMPVMNGWEFLDAFDQQFDEDFKKNVVVVMLTALDTEETTALAMSNPNVTDTAQKPLSDLKFRVLINKYFS
ncbi:response regulator [Flagellimonas pacifica]|uniref:Response regulator receiver domain-containing protein n=1 Tax=Flagellimonas pacifica TaxID=1247520 RepID=A0A285MX03_9FLAO|nr:response regulator [Allomuricauda parva]SNZ00011.1 Response regulator receiver domain-containing protein [Allomuricauda parva]